MKFCEKCGTQLQDSDAVCSNCGAQCSAPATKVRATNTTMLVWAIINIALCSKICGIVALVYTLSAQNAETDEEENRKLKNAKTWNIVGTALPLAYILIYVLITIVSVGGVAFLGTLAAFIAMLRSGN